MGVGQILSATGLYDDGRDSMTMIYFENLNNEFLNKYQKKNIFFIY
jgi:hypothetical protein